MHRSLISAHGWGDGGLTAFDIENLAETANKISETERRSMLAERDTTGPLFGGLFVRKNGIRVSR